MKIAWEDVSLYCAFSADSDWRKSAHVKFSPEELEALSSRVRDDELRHIHHAIVHDMSDEIVKFLLPLLPRCCSLQSLFLHELKAAHCELFAQLFRGQLRELKQLKVGIGDEQQNCCKTLFESIADMPKLTALGLSCWSEEKSVGQTAIHFVDAIGRLSQLSYLEMFFADRTWLQTLCERLAPPKSLRHIQICSYWPPANDMQLLCDLYTRVPHLDSLYVNIMPDSLPILTSWLNASFRSLRVFACYMVGAGNDAILSFFHALAANTRLDTLLFQDFHHWELLDNATLLQRGWLCTLGSNAPAYLDAIVKKNVARRQACQKLCVVLIAAKTGKRAFRLLPKELVINVARYLWDTRNQVDWESE